MVDIYRYDTNFRVKYQENVSKKSQNYQQIKKESTQHLTAQLVPFHVKSLPGLKVMRANIPNER